MILTCPNCVTRYQTDATIAPPGRNVRCAKCGQVWFQEPEPEAEPEPEPEIEVVHEHQPSMAMAMGSHAGAVDEGVAEPVHDMHARPRRRGGFGRVLGWLLLIIVVIAAIFAILNYRQMIATLWPKSASLYAAIGMPVNVLGLALRDVTPAQSLETGEPLLEVRGRVVNITNHRIPVPKVRVALIDGEQREIYRWVFDPGVGALEGGADGPFVTRLPSPPREAKNISVRFVEAGEQ